MDKKDIIKMLKTEVESKADEATLAKLKEAKSPKEALSILEEASIELNEDSLAAIAGGSGDEDDVNGLGIDINWCKMLFDCDANCRYYCPKV